ncbi:MAG TPA: M56 family metallopeptidase, partial [Desulfosporosinus sp.]|nr:M56 family metallopeptidase [Desulfosporosinus sp.]
MGNLLSSLLAMSVAGSVVVGLMLLLRPVTAKIFPAKWQYGMGKMAIAFFLIPVSLFSGKFSLLLPQTITQSHYSEPPTMAIPGALRPNGFVDAMDGVMKKHLSVEVMGAILFIWLVGAMVFTGWHFYCYRRFTKQLRANSIPVPEDVEATALLSSCQSALGIHGEVKLMQNYKIASPMLVGLIRPMILLPTSNMQEIDLKLVLTHELTHLKQKDLWVKMLALAAGMLHWFNLLVHVLRKDVNTWVELSCDEALASKMSHEERKLYGETILNTLDISSGIDMAFCSSLRGSGKHIERRLTMLLNVKKTKKHIAVFAVVATLAIGGTGMATSAYAAENTPKVDSTLQQIKKPGNPSTQITDGNEAAASLIPSDTAVVMNSIDNEKMVELKGDGKEYTFDEFKQWMEDARLEAAELVKSGIWAQEQADKKLASYESLIAEIEKNGGKTFGKLIDKGDGVFPESIETFYAADELVFELPAKLADTTNGEVGFVLSV